MYSKLRKLIAEFNFSDTFRIYDDGKVLHLMVNADFEEVTKDVERYLLAAYDQKASDIELTQKQISRLELTLGSRPIKIESIVFYDDVESIKCLVYVKGQRSTAIRNKWTKRISKKLNFPEDQIYMEWTKEEGKVIYA